jgi:glycerophosphoryl diester phosphodiesterase
MGPPQLVAHRGGAALAPENTLGAFRFAHGSFHDVWLELDVHLSRDGRLVVIHDHTLDRTTDRSGLVCELDASELAACNAAARWPSWESEGVPTLDAVLREGAGAGWRIVCEIKNIPGEPDFDPDGTRHVDALAASLETTGFPLERLAVICFWPPTLDLVKARVGGVRTGFLTVARDHTVRENVQLCVERGYELSSPQHATPDLDGPAVDEAHDRGPEVWVWTANSPEDIARLVSMGVDGITSDHPDRLVAAVTQG